MKCYHLLPRDHTPFPTEYATLDVSESDCLLVHSDTDGCKLPGTCGHLLISHSIPSTLAAALEPYGVLTSDTCASMALKMSAFNWAFRP